MKIEIELPEEVFEALRALAGQEGASLEAVIVRMVAEEIGPVRLGGSAGGKRVRLPLVPSKRPGTLRSMTGAEIEELLG